MRMLNLDEEASISKLIKDEHKTTRNIDHVKLADLLDNLIAKTDKYTKLTVDATYTVRAVYDEVKGKWPSVLQHAAFIDSKNMLEPFTHQLKEALADMIHEID